MYLDHYYIIPMDAIVTTVSGLGTTVKNRVLCYCIQNLEMYIFEIDHFSIPKQYYLHFQKKQMQYLFQNVFMNNPFPRLKFLVLKIIYIYFIN